MRKIFTSFGIACILTLAAANSFAQGGIDSVTFENPSSNVILDTAGGNLWQTGAPQKTYFNAAHNGNRAILTDTADFYPPDDTSSFILVIHNPITQSCHTELSFWHKYDMGSTGDKGIIEASYDGGNSWLLLKDTNLNGFGSMFAWNYDYINDSNDFVPHQLIITGRSNGWIRSDFFWDWWIPVKNDTIILNPDSLMIRFTFMSDSVAESREGWMIDDIVFESWPMSACSGVDEYSGQTGMTVAPNPFSLLTNLYFPTFLVNAKLTLYNCYGVEVKSVDHICGQSYTLNRENLPDGIFLLVIAQGNKILVRDIIVISGK